ncbi:MAG: toxin-antitoxin system YwqK family antitoxin [Tenacibaculum sp.]
MKKNKPQHSVLFIAKKILLIIVFFLGMTDALMAQKKYVKDYYLNGNLKEEGWLDGADKTAYWIYYYKNGVLKKKGHHKNNIPVKYWYFYYKNSKKQKEGHYINGKQSKWWLYYDNKGYINHKCQLKDNKKNGYCLIYDKNQLIKVAKYKSDKKIKEWSSFSSFKKENNFEDLK